MAYDPAVHPASSQYRGMNPMPVIPFQTDADGTPVGPAYRSPVLVGTEDLVTVPDTGELVLASNADRTGFLLHNNGVDSAYLGLTDTVTSSNGRLLASGDSLSSREMPGYGGAIYAITGTGDSADISVFEW